MSKDKLVWKTIGAEDHWLELAYTAEGTGIVEGKTIKPIWDHHVILKWDGCVDYSTYCNGYGYDHKCDENCERGVGCCREYIHICDMESHIE